VSPHSEEPESSLAERLSALEAERDIRALMVRYAETLDYGDEAGWAACFTKDGIFDVRRRGVEMFRHDGTEALEKFAAGHTSAPEVYHKHFLSIPDIALDGASASAKTYFTMLRESESGPIVLVFGRYLDDFERVDGRWLLAKRIVDMEALPPSV
jgi:3-phenylpropionate/cinnamic acid dioxygenase small subunit